MRRRKSLLKYVAKRLAFLVPTLFGITALSFILINLAPGGPVQQKLQALRFGAGKTSRLTATGSQQVITAELVEALNKQYGFDQPPLRRYLNWLGRLARLDLGKSSVFERPALDVILERAPVSLAFGAAAFVLTYVIAIGLGLLMAAREGTLVDAGINFTLVAMTALPAFILGVLLLVVFAGDGFVRWFPLGYLQSDDYATLPLAARILDRLHHAVLPLFCYVFGALTATAQLQRGSVLSEKRKDYVRTARAKGLPERTILLRHIFRNASLPLVTGLGGTLAGFVGGSVLVESVFQLNGLGLLSLQAVLSRDYNLMMALLLVSSLLLLVGNLVGDLLYMVLDPNVRLEKAG